MYDCQEFTVEQIRGELRQDTACIAATSGGLGWSSAYASLQRERPFEANLSRIDGCLIILHRSGPVSVNFRITGDRTISQQRRRGQISFIPGACRGHVDLRAPHDTLHIYLRSELFDGHATRLTPLLGIEDPILENLAAAIGGAVTDRLPRSSLYVDPVAQAIARRVLDIAQTGAERRGAQRLSNRQLTRIREFVEAHLEDDIRVADLAKAGGVGAKRLKNTFEISTGTTPYQYVLTRRIGRARELLADKTLSLPEIALRSGFCNQEHLTRVFRGITGLSPGRYRRGVE
jgi:AraC family transcriptional regulator